MNKGVKIVGYGFVMWFVPFLVSLVIYPIRTFANPFFESIMPVVIAITVVLLAITYFKTVNANFLKEGILIGISWFLVCISIDFLLFLSPSPMQMSFTNYIMDIGFTYLIIPIVTVGMGYILVRQ